MNQTLQEFVDSRGQAMRIDRAAGVIHGVKVLGLRSRNRRRYPPNTLQAAMPLYEGAKVNVNHAKGQPFGPRDYQDRIGVIRGVRFQPDEGLFADLHFNPKHLLAEQLAWDAQHAPENVGLSHNVEARTRFDQGETIVESIAAVHSVDLVADPATTRGLFEECSDERNPAPGGVSACWDKLTIEALAEHRPDLIDHLCCQRDQQIAQLREEVAAHRSLVAESQRRLLIARLLAEKGLPWQPSADGAVTARFLESLQAASDEAALRELIADRARLVREARWWHGLISPSGAQSRDQLAVDHPRRVSTTEDFVRAIT